MKTAFLFPGQGAQFVGMGKDIAQAVPAAAKIFETANSVVGFDLSRICFEGPAEQLNTTAVSQPAIFTTSAALLETLRTTLSTGPLQPDVTAGLSLGEYTALYAAGVIDFRQALGLVKKRGEAMQQAAEAQQGAMVSIIGLDEEKVANLCDEAARGELLVPVNFNCPGQIVISGTGPACKRAEQLATKFGAIKAVKLEVAGAFHTQMMASAAEALRKALASSTFSSLGNTKIIANINADYYRSTAEIKEGLTKQLTSPILWQKSMEKLIADRVEILYEIGPGKVLTGLLKRIDRKARIVNISSLQAIKELAQA